VTPIRVLSPVKYGGIALLPTDSGLSGPLFSVDDAFASDWIASGKAESITPTATDTVTELIYEPEPDPAV